MDASGRILGEASALCEEKQEREGPIDPVSLKSVSGKSSLLRTFLSLQTKAGVLPLWSSDLPMSPAVVRVGVHGH